MTDIDGNTNRTCLHWTEWGKLKHYMIIMDTMENCYRFMKFKQFNPSDCVLIPISRNMRERMLGYYDQVINGEIELFGISKKDFAKIYLGNNKAFEEEYSRTHGFTETELKSSSLANKELKIIRGYLKGNSIVIEDWWQKITGEDWRTSAIRNPAACNYSLNHLDGHDRSSVWADWVLYGKIGGFGYLVNVTELELPEDYNPKEDYVFVEKN